jgi:hypothetical protein
MTRVFLAMVGVTYLILAGYCALLPARASKTVGLSIQPGAGESEFLTVYAGLEFGLALVFLWPLFSSAESSFHLLACLLVHGSLVLFRSVGFLLYTGIPTSTYQLAAGEWAIFLGAAYLFWRK